MCIAPWFRTAVLVAAACSAPGCATLMAGGPDRVKMVTNPPGATVFVDAKPRGQTPVFVDLDREQDHGELRLELAGFQPVNIVRSKRVNGWIWGDVLTGGLIGIVIDLAAGNASQFDDDPIAVGLTPSTGGDALPPPSLLAPEECRRERRRILNEAATIRDPAGRLQAVHAAPVCK